MQVLGRSILHTKQSLQLLGYLVAPIDMGSYLLAGKTRDMRIVCSHFRGRVGERGTLRHTFYEHQELSLKLSPPARARPEITFAVAYQGNMAADHKPRRISGTERDEVLIVRMCEGILSKLAARDGDQMKESRRLSSFEPRRGRGERDVLEVDLTRVWLSSRQASACFVVFLSVANDRQFHIADSPSDVARSFGRAL